jgi:hypothetical protein
LTNARAPSRYQSCCPTKRLAVSLGSDFAQAGTCDAMGSFVGRFRTWSPNGSHPAHLPGLPAASGACKSRAAPRIPRWEAVGLRATRASQRHTSPKHYAGHRHSSLVARCAGRGGATTLNAEDARALRPRHDAGFVAISWPAVACVSPRADRNRHSRSLACRENPFLPMANGIWARQLPSLES